MVISVNEKVAAFCRELADSALRDIARDEGMEPVFLRAEESLKSGRVDAALAADIDALDAMVRRVEGQGLYPAATRGYEPLPGPGSGTGAQWWTCPREQCAGRGRVRPRQEAPVCGATGKQLVPGPFPE